MDSPDEALLGEASGEAMPTLRLTIRGVDERDDDVRAVFDTDPAMLILLLR